VLKGVAICLRHYGPPEDTGRGSFREKELKSVVICLRHYDPPEDTGRGSFREKECSHMLKALWPS